MFRPAVKYHHNPSQEVPTKRSLCSSLSAAASVALALLVASARAQDTTPPTLVGASSIDGRQVGVCFSEAMERSLLAFKMAQEEGADLLVTGAYGHSRLGEWVFGGMTGDLIATSPICCLMSH
jgi:nucleotide-binding universal stress UspA family protein